MLKTTLPLFLLIFCCFAVNAQSNDVKSIAVNFKIKNAGIGVDGKFNAVKAKVLLDATDPGKSSFVGTAEAASIRTGINLRDDHLRDKEDFFNVKKYPTLTMKSVSVTPKNSSTYTVVWDLTIKGNTRRFSSDVQVKSEGTNTLLATEFKINRRDWNLGGKSITMSDVVAIRINAIVSN